ncbi:MAG: hypothetical protein GY913_33480 [Proteobacteria bacterium]|nr:hypothetical protein [Pseudomonadota bacterium]MCP4921839.1 hypothetical protein [Pseudomonadota bacterium]
MILLLGCELSTGFSTSTEQPVLDPVERIERIERIPVDPWSEVEASPTPEGCVTGPLSCGSVLEDRTTGGHSQWSNDHYRTLFCHPIHHDWDGPERVYRLVLPAQTVATVELESEGDLDLFALSWPHDDCPTTQMSVSSCDADVGTSGGSLTLVTQDRDQTFLVAADGKSALEGAFRLSVECVAR